MIILLEQMNFIPPIQALKFSLYVRVRQVKLFLRPNESSRHSARLGVAVTDK